MAKRCFKCRRFLPLTEFYRHPAMGDGHLGKCKDCAKADGKRHRRDLMADPEKRAAELARNRSRYYADRQRTVARWTIKNAVRDGRVVRPAACSRCGKNCTPQAHHADYAKPLEVIWLCRDCHALERLGEKRKRTPY